MLSTSFPKLQIPSISIPSRTETYKTYNSKQSKGVLMTSMNDTLRKYSKIKKETNFDWLYPPIDWCYRSDKYIPPQRIPFTANYGKETTYLSYFNQERAKVMKKREFNRLTSAAKKPIYGNISEKEIYRKNIRDILKYQISEKDREIKIARRTLAEEFDRILATDILARENQSKIVREKTIYLRQFRDANKTLMEKKWAEAKEIKKRDILVEQDMLKLDPINWSRSLT